MLDVIFKFAAGDLTARGALSGDDSALDGVMAGINILGEELQAQVAENKQVQDALQQALEYAQTLIRSSPNGILAVDLNLRVTEWNLLMEQMCGKSREQVIGRYLDEIPLLKDTGEVTRVKLAFEGESIGTREIAYRLPGEDKDRFFDSLLAPLHGPTGEVVGAVLRILDTTERKRVEVALIESESRLRTLLESVQAGIVIIDPEIHRIVDVNPYAARMIGAPKEAIIGAECHKFICPAERGRCPATDLHQTVDSSERVLLTAAGERREIIKTVITVQLGGRPHLLESFIDITERKRAEHALSESEDLLRTLFDSVQDGIILAEAQSKRFRMVNNSICRMLGYSPDELLKVGVKGIHPEESLPYVLSQFERLAKGEIGLAPDLPMKRKDGSVFYVDVNTGPMMINGVACLVGVFRDITERQQAQQALSESESMLRNVFDTVQEGIILADAKTRRFKMVNDSICRMLGYSREELLELEVKDIHPEEEVANVMRQIKRQLKHEITLAPNLPVKRKDGTIFYADINATPMQVKETLFLLGVFRDITERKRAEQAEERASRDSLTGLYNHRTFYSLLKDEIVRTQRFNRPMSLLMLDIDHFKRVNDTHGHQAGDAILKGLSDLLVKDARAVDRMCRYGGEEFAVILPETDASEAMQSAERLRAAVEHQPFDIGGGKAIGITISIGVVSYPQQANSQEGLVKAADVALYAAKQGGRNRVCHYEAEMAGQNPTA